MGGKWSMIDGGEVYYPPPADAGGSLGCAGAPRSEGVIISLEQGQFTSACLFGAECMGQQDFTPYQQKIIKRLLQQ